MARANKNGWDFVKAGSIYQYKEDSLILIVEILEDNSDDDYYSFKVLPIAGNYNFKDTFTVYFSKGLSGTFNGASQFYREVEYMPMPIGTSWKFVFDEVKLNTTEYVWGE